MAITIQQFFSSYLDAYRRQNVDSITACFAVPCIIADGGAQRVLDNGLQVQRHVQESLANFTAMGLTAERLTLRSLLMISDEFAVTNVAFSMLGSNRNLRTFHIAYNVRRIQGGNWAIWAVTEHEKFKE